jgi:hypothetical protein
MMRLRCTRRMLLGAIVASAALSAQAAPPAAGFRFGVIGHSFKNAPDEAVLKRPSPTRRRSIRPSSSPPASSPPASLAATSCTPSAARCWTSRRSR